MQEVYCTNGYSQLSEPPISPIGATSTEIENLEQQLGIALPIEYSRFLRRWRYLDIYVGYSIWPPNSPAPNGDVPWLSGDHRPPYKYLVFGDYWNFADGDSLMFDINQPQSPVVLYLHDEQAIEYFAPSFSLALWRIANFVCE